MSSNTRYTLLSAGIISVALWCVLEYISCCGRMKRREAKRNVSERSVSPIRVALVEEPSGYVINRSDVFDTTYRSGHTPLKVQMSTGGERQCGLGSLLPMSCRGRAEAFARRLHTRLRRLGAEPRLGEDEWLTAQPNNNRRHHSDSDVYFDFDVDLGSPTEDVTDASVPNGKPLPSARVDPESGCVFSSPIDLESPHSNSDSDGNYFDIDTEGESGSSKPHRKYHKHQEDGQAVSGINLSKLKLSKDLREHLINCQTPTPDRRSPIKTQPLARENGFADYGTLTVNQSNLYSPIRFDDCEKRDSVERETFQLDNGGDHLDGAEFYPDGFMSPQEPELDEIDISQKVTSVREFPLRDADFKLLVDENNCDAPLSECFESPCTKENKEDIENKEKQPDETIEKENTDDTLHLGANKDTHVSERDDSTQTEECLEAAVAENKEAVHSDAENDDRPLRVRRCSSLRTGKTPPGTPGRKKIVRFADVLGLDLADVKTFMDDIPNIPKSAFEDLRDADLGVSGQTDSSLQPLTLPPLKDKHLVCMFQIPGDQSNFLDILNSRSVCLENAVIQEGATVCICGTVRVRNLDFHKSVQIRYSVDGWKTFSDLQATYVPNSCDGFSDRFQFLLYAHTLTEGQKLEFAVRFMCKGCQFWDNNDGINYCFQCISNGQSSNYYQLSCLHPGDNWHSSFY